MPVSITPIKITSTPVDLSDGLSPGSRNRQNTGPRIFIKSTDSSTPPPESERAKASWIESNQWFTLETENGIYDWVWTRGGNVSYIVD